MSELIVTDVTVASTVAPSGAPAAPTDFTITEAGDGNPTITLSWEHDGVDLDRFEILQRPVGATTWESWTLGPASDFGVVPNYSFVTGTTENTEWVVRALNVDGEVSV